MLTQFLMTMMKILLLEEKIFQDDKLILSDLIIINKVDDNNLTDKIHL